MLRTPMFLLYKSVFSIEDFIRKTSKKSLSQCAFYAIIKSYRKVHKHHAKVLNFKPFLGFARNNCNHKAIVVASPKKHSTLIFFIAVSLYVFSPLETHASVLTSFVERVKAIMISGEPLEEEAPTSQTMQVLKPTVIDESEIKINTQEEDITEEGLKATYGALRLSTEDIDYPTNDSISVYEVKKGDTLARVAKLFGVSKNTIIWANDLKSENLTPGDTLLILPVTGIKHTVKKGDTIPSIAKKYKAELDDVAKYNGVAKDAELSVGTVLLVPEGELAVVLPKPKATTVKPKILASYTTASPDGFFVRPVNGGRRTQGIHGYNGIDIAATPGTPIIAAAGGQVLVARSSGYNGGYGSMVIISHAGNIQTLYAHMRAVYIMQGQTVTQGQVIGEVGNTGRSTGPHLHFEVRGAKNPF